MREYVIGCDNAALELKNKVKDHLIEKGFQVEDLGINYEKDSTIYPNIAKAVCEKVQASNFEKRGILICGTGIGMAMSANKCKGIRAAQVNDPYSAERAVLSNNANVFCLGARVTGRALALKIVDEFTSLEFVDSPSTEKIEGIMEIEKENYR